MANYNNYYPYAPYTPYGTPYQTVQQPQQQPAPTSQNQQPQIINGGLVSVWSEDEARMYPVAPGNRVAFINENAPYCYTKTMGFSQFDRPRFDIYRKVKEEPKIVPVSEESSPSVEYALKADFDSLQGSVYELQKELQSLLEKINAPEKKTTAKVKKEAEE